MPKFKRQDEVLIKGKVVNIHGDSIQVELNGNGAFTIFVDQSQLKKADEPLPELEAFKERFHASNINYQSVKCPMCSGWFCGHTLAERQNYPAPQLTLEILNNRLKRAEQYIANQFLDIPTHSNRWWAMPSPKTQPNAQEAEVMSGVSTLGEPELTESSIHTAYPVKGDILVNGVLYTPKKEGDKPA